MRFRIFSGILRDLPRFSCKQWEASARCRGSYSQEQPTGWAAGLKQRIVQKALRNSLLLVPTPTAGVAHIPGSSDSFELYKQEIVRSPCVNKHLLRDFMQRGSRIQLALIFFVTRRTLGSSVRKRDGKYWNGIPHSLSSSFLFYTDPRVHVAALSFQSVQLKIGNANCARHTYLVQQIVLSGSGTISVRPCGSNA